jgi:hypothetical protein
MRVAVGLPHFINAVPRLLEELGLQHGNGSFGQWLLQLTKKDALLLDD